MNAPARVRRFSVGDAVDAVRGGITPVFGAKVLSYVDTDPTETTMTSGGCGVSARYRISGYDGEVYDWMLNPTNT